MKRWFKLELWQQIFIALALGIISGFLLGHRVVYLKPIGTLFINAIHMMVVPVVFTAIVCAVTSIRDPQKMRRIGLRTVLIYAACMTVAACISLLVSSWISPGLGLHLTDNHSAAASLHNVAPNLVDLVTSIVPTNAVSAFSSGNIPQILVFALILGLSINLAGEKGEQVAHFFGSLSEVVFKLTHIIMSCAPYGIFALMAWVTGQFGVQALIPLLKLLGTIYLCFALHIMIVYGGVLVLLLRINPLAFLRAIAEVLLFAFSSSSSAATLPVSLRCAEQKLGISKNISGFLLPLGASLNLNGLSIYLAAATVFTANVYGIHLGLIQYITLVFSIVLTSMGAGGVPASGLIVMSAVMGSVGLPLGTIPLIAGIDRLVDMGSTTTNVMGDLFSTLTVAKIEGEVDLEVLNPSHRNAQVPFSHLADVRVTD